MNIQTKGPASSGAERDKLAISPGIAPEAERPETSPSGPGVPLTLAQRRIWTLGQIGNDTVFPNQVLALRWRGPTTPTEIERAVMSLVERQPGLMIRIRRLAGGRTEQVVDTGSLPAMTRIDLSRSAPGEIDSDLSRAIDAVAARRFDLDGGAPWRAEVIRLGADVHALVLVLHPIVCDPASLAILAADLCDAAGSPGPAMSEPVQFQRANAEQLWLRSPDAQAALDFWRETFAEERECASLPTRRRVETAGAAAGDAITPAKGQRGVARFAIDAGLRQRLAETSARAGLNETMILSTAFALLLARYGGHHVLRCGMVTTHRTGDATGAIGRLEDVVPLRLDFDPAMGAAEACRHLAARLGDGERYRVPIERLLQEVWRDDSDRSGPFIRSVFEMRDAFVSGTAGAATMEALLPPAARADFDLALTIAPGAGDTLDGVIGYCRETYEPGIIEDAAGCFVRILAQMTDDAKIRLRDIQLVDAAELERLSAPYPDDAVDDDRPVHELIARHAGTTPDKIAIICGAARITHAALEARANRLAHRLIACGVGAEIPVAIAMKRSEEAVIAILAVLKAGGAYIPVEPDHPERRNAHIFGDAGIKVVLTNSWLAGRLPPAPGATVLELDRLDLSSEPETAPERGTRPDQLAYIMYTSGSTGLPKGVAVEHGPLTHHNQATSRVYEMSSDSRELPFLPFSSDGGHERWMVPLMEGGSIVIPDQPLWTPEETLQAMREHGTNNASIPTTYMQQLAEWADITDGAPPMRLYSFGGEGLAQTTFDLLSRSLKSEWLINGYGPTETIMTPMVWKVRPGTTFEGTYAPIGRAVGRRRVYVLDADMNPCPVGVTGELYLGGEGVARGYVGRPGTTADRFVPDPFSAEGGRLYTSGDLCRWQADGTVEILGRVDHQIKLRGFRIELGEIEAAFVAEEGVGECLTILRDDDGQQALVAYVVPEQDAVLDADILRRQVARRLPDYMVPAAIVLLERMPTNPNGKLDRFALPAPGLRRAPIVPPETALEADLVGIWQTILGIPAVGIDDNFFDIGGHSLAAIRILTAIRRLKPRARITIADLFNHQTIRRLAGMIDSGATLGGQVITLRAEGSRPMLYCFPGLLVSTREYVKLVEHLGPEQPATGFICYSLSEDKAANGSVDTIVSRYAEHIRATSRGQSCFFLGWSWGGLLAYEAARMLGSDIDLRLVGMIDVCNIGSEFALGAIPRFAPGERAALDGRVREWLGRTKMRGEWDRLIGGMDATVYEQFLRFIGNEEEDLPTDGPDISSREHTFWILIDNALIFRRHQMLPFDAPIHSWTAEDSLARGLDLVDWRRFSQRANAAEIIAGTTHLHIIGSPIFHSRLASRLDAATADLPTKGRNIGGGDRRRIR